MKEYLIKTSIGRLTPQDTPYEVMDTKVVGFLLRVQPSGKMTYYVSYRLADGRRQRKRLGGTDALEPVAARALAKQVLAEVAQGGDPLASRREARVATLGEFIEGQYSDWATAHRKAGRGTVKRLCASFGPSWDQGRLWNKPVGSVTAWDIERWRNQRTQATGRRTAGNREVACLKAALSKAVEWGVIPENPVAKVKLAKTDRRKTIRVLSEAEEEALFRELVAREEEARERRASYNRWRRERHLEEYPDLAQAEFADFLRPMITVMLHTGIRRGEAFTLSWNDVDLQNSRLTVRGKNAKSGQTRTIPLNDVAADTLGRWRSQSSGEGLVFPSPVTGGKLDNVRKTWLDILGKAGIAGLCMHDLRHTFATRLIASGADIETVRHLLGHTDITTTQIYLHTNEDRMRSAVRALGGKTNSS